MHQQGRHRSTQLSELLHYFMNFQAKIVLDCSLLHGFLTKEGGVEKGLTDKRSFMVAEAGERGRIKC